MHAISTQHQATAIVLGLHAARIEFLVVGRMAAFLQGVIPTRGEMVDVVLRRAPENIARVVAWLRAHDGRDWPPRSFGPPTVERELQERPSREHIGVQTTLGRLNLVADDYDSLFLECLFIRSEDIEKGSLRPVNRTDTVFPVMIVESFPVGTGPRH